MLIDIEHAEDSLTRCEGKIAEWLRDKGYFLQNVDGIEDIVKLVEEGKKKSSSKLKGWREYGATGR
ncbi:hypothetical protein QS257_06795 [Terrilactibacillus sp. S3-3]|nr:hypothetical protein QS257_06795 [Terrilactibacillus sp. S3-3]